METIRVYMASGMLELFVLGELTLLEELQVRQMALLYPVVRREIEAIELALEQYALQNSIAPNLRLRSKIISLLSE